MFENAEIDIDVLIRETKNVILMKLGALEEKRTHRKEGEKFVKVDVKLPYKLNPETSYILRWNCGNTLDVLYKIDRDKIALNLCSVNMTNYGISTRSPSSELTAVSDVVLCTILGHATSI